MTTRHCMRHYVRTTFARGMHVDTDRVCVFGSVASPFWAPRLGVDGLVGDGGLGGRGGQGVEAGEGGADLLPEKPAQADEEKQGEQAAHK